MRLFLLFTGLLFVTVACQPKADKIFIDETEHVSATPPGVVMIRNNFYVDETEVTNFHWMEYRNWVAKVYGESSEEHLATAPRDSVWMNYPIEKRRDGFLENYAEHPAYRDYPVVGLTLQQAEWYCQWRSDRVAEFILIREEYISIEPDQTPENHFTAERYFAGEYMEYTSPAKGIVMPQYTVPTKAEWEEFASAGLSTDTFPIGMDWSTKKMQKQLRKDSVMFNYNMSTDGTWLDSIGDPALPVFSYYPNDYGIYQSCGNVAEMVQEPFVAKGGSWFHAPDSCTVVLDLPYDAPNMWLGFRCVCALYLPK
jgi:sulfatase modifying factor 1